MDVDAPGGGFVTLRYVDGLHLENSPRTLNSISQDGNSVTPRLSSRTVEIAPCTKLHVGFSTERVSVPEPFAGILGDRLTGAGGELFSESGRVIVFANIVSQLEHGGVQGWSLSLNLKGDGDFSSVTTEGTAAAPSPDGYRSGGFERTEIINPGHNGDRKGVVSAVILSLEPDVHLPLVGTESVLKLLLLLSSPTKKDLSVILSFADGLAGTGQPVSNLMAVEDDDLTPCNSRTAAVTVKSTRVPFLRGDSNINGRVTIADAVFTLGHLFLGRHADTPCRKALDANGDGAVNISDPMYTLAYLFLGGPPIPAPYPSCGNETTPDGLSCTTFNACP
jgi:hypothetical protein